ncbi:GerAB/ArcD/ProY family transporter [Paenibacillus humicola]|uniref:GerAB/ArcD/ProY family transporter n=1 Tax=Paenibacillus humicola TaxID=3110540 RepID=UPI00237B2B93|nr:endospore germination permease [Paenibacillus humicola]
MIEKEKISSFQMAVMMFIAVLATGDLLAPAIAVRAAGIDMWLSPIWASLSGFSVVYICYRLHKLYPNETIIQYCVSILGSILGKTAGLLILFFLLHDVGVIIREYTDFIIGHFLPKTPMIVVLGSMCLVCAFAVRGGVEALGRLALLFVPVVVLLWVLIVILLIPNLQLELILPVMEKGVGPSLKGAIPLQSWYTHLFLSAFLLPSLTDQERGMKRGMATVLSLIIALTVLNLTVLLLFGEVTVSLTYPVFEAVRYIRLAGFFEHLEAVVIAIWVLGGFVKISVYFYVLALGASQWLKMNDYRPLVFPFGFMIILSGFWSASNIQELSNFLSTIAPFYLSTFRLAIPMFLLVIAIFRKRFSGEH